MAIDNESWPGKLRDWTVLKTPAMATTRMGWATFQRELMTFGLAEWLSQDMAGADVVIRFEERRSAPKQNTELIDTDLCSPALPGGSLDDKTMSDQWTSPPGERTHPVSERRPQTFSASLSPVERTRVLVRSRLSETIIPRLAAYTARMFGAERY
jgi:hypothetical protein